MSADARLAVERVFREAFGRAIAVLVRAFGDIDVAEEVVADAFAVAIDRWPIEGVPPSPAGWIVSTARRRAIDRLRRESTRDERHAVFMSYRVPEATELPTRTRGVLHTIYLVFNEGYVASSGDVLQRDDLSIEAIRLARLVCALLPDNDEARGLLALLLLIQSRRDARTTAGGALVPLGEQNRAAWDPALIAEGQMLVRDCLRVNRPGPYQLQAAIQDESGRSTTHAPRSNVRRR